MSLTLFHLLQGVDVPRIQHKRLLADDIGTETQTITGMGIVQIIRRAYADIVNVGAAVAQLGVVSVEKFLFGKEGSLWEIAVHDAYAVAFVVGGDKVVTCVFDGFEVARGDVAADTNDGEIFHCLYLEKQILHKSVTNFVFLLFVGVRLALIGLADGASSKLGWLVSDQIKLNCIWKQILHKSKTNSFIGESD